MPPEAMTRDGWVRVPDDGFIELAGPLWQREAGGGMELAIATTDKHRDRSGIVLADLHDECAGLDQKIKAYDDELAALTREDEQARQAPQAPGRLNQGQRVIRRAGLVAEAAPKTASDRHDPHHRGLFHHPDKALLREKAAA